MKRKRTEWVTRGMSAALLALILAVGAAGCGKKDDAAKESEQAQEAASQTLNPEQITEEGKEEIKEEAGEEEKEEVKEEVKEEAREKVKEEASKEAEKTEEETADASDETGKDSAVIEKPRPSDESPKEEGGESEEEDKDKEEKEEKKPGGLALMDGKMKFDGQELEFPIELGNLNLGNWSLSYENVEDPSEKTLSPGEVVTASMKNEAYPDTDVKVTAEFGNYTGESAALTDLPMTGIYIEKVGKGEDVKLPEVELPGGLTWGSTEEEIRELFGEASLSGTFQKDFDFMYENGEYMMELAGMKDTGLDYIVYCEE